MGKTHRERQDKKRDERLENMSKQIESGDLTVRQMTPEERSRWDEHSAASARDLTPDERARRSAALKKRERIQEMRKPSRDEGRGQPNDDE
jgi:hypothetical protein